MPELRRSVAALLLAVWFVDAPAAAMTEALSCLLEPSLKVEVSSAVPGIVTRVAVERGDRIKKGQVLVRLESALQTADLAAARARLEFSERRGKRNQDLFAKHLISVHDKDQMETEHHIAAVELEQAEDRLALRTIHSPLSGFVIERKIAPGEFVDNRPFMTIVDIDPLFVEVVVPVTQLGRIRRGMTAMVTPDQIGGRYRAKVVIVDPVVDPTSDTFGVRLKLPNPGDRLPAGLKCEVEFVAK